ncbi:MAG TPA: hypothetical protein VHX90_07630 [Verrucomicrobiae bacterium]|jgi:hypothetical protein|nr:hypothetical protein [Verrucomicrobiae bacterium]
MKKKPELYAAHLKDCAVCKTGALCDAGKNLLADAQEDNAQEICCHAAAGDVQLTGGVLPTNLQWMPPGKHSVQPVGFEAPFEINVTREIAAKADAQLQEMLSAHAAGQDVQPYIDINHEDKVRAFLPTKLSWGGEDPKNGGIRVEGKWTGGGANAALNGEQCVVSPSWGLHKVTKAFLGIKRNLGGLVPRSAFTSIQAFAKADSSNETKNKNKKMTTEDKAEIGQLIADAITKNNTTLEANAKSSNEATLLRVKALEEADTTMTLANAKKTVEEIGVRGGRIASQDTATVEFWTQACAKDSKAVDALTKMAVNPAFVQIVNAGGGAGLGGTTTSEHEFVVKAKTYGETNKITSAVEAQAKFAQTKDGSELYKNYLESVAPGTPTAVRK